MPWRIGLLIAAARRCLLAASAACPTIDRSCHPVWHCIATALLGTIPWRVPVRRLVESYLHDDGHLTPIASPATMSVFLMTAWTPASAVRATDAILPTRGTRSCSSTSTSTSSAHRLLTNRDTPPYDEARAYNRPKVHVAPRQTGQFPTNS